MELFMNILDDVIGFVKDTVDSAMETWNNLEDDKRKLLIGCIAAAAVIIAVASIAYNVGKARGQQYLEEEDF